MSENDRQLNLPKREEEILKFWDEHQIFKKTLEKTKDGKPFIFYEGPPTANGNPGIHHFEARAFKDAIPRYKTMRGFRVDRKAGWDTHGLPVEIQVEKELGLKTKKDIEKFGIAEFNAHCRESVWQYKEEWTRFTKRIGYWLDLEHPYITYETSYIESLWWIISEFWKKKLLYQDFKVVPWCTRCETALSTHELGLGYQTVRDRSVYVRFRLKSKERKWQNASILSWTTTPWTLPGNVALAVNADENYVAIPDPDEKGHWIILAEKRFRDLVEAHAFPPQYRSSIMLDDIDTFKGKDLIGIEYEPLFPVKELSSEKSWRVYAADFVTMDDGSGVVHTAVMYGEDDYRLGKEIGLPAFHTVDQTGHFIKELGGNLGGKYVKDSKTEDAIIESMKERGLLFREEQYEHEYPFCWRCGTAVLYYARNAWWVKMSSLRPELMKNNETIHWVPEYLKHGRFGEFIKEARDWAFSRERYWGTPLPIWQCENCDVTEVIGRLSELDQFDPAPTKLYVMRHGEALHNVKGVIIPTTPANDARDVLTEYGIQMAEVSAHSFKKKKIDVIISSPSMRTRQTAKIVAEEVGCKIIETMPELADLDVKTFEGRPTSDYLNAFSTFAARFIEKPEGAETLRELRSRIMRAIGEIRKRYVGKTVLVVSHGDPIWILTSALEGRSEASYEGMPYPKPAEVRELALHNWPYNTSGEVDLHRPFIDEITLRCKQCQGTMRRVPEVADVWFDSGSMPFAQYHYPFEQKNDLPFPADYICEAVDQTRGWFYTMLAVSTALGRGTSFKNVISLGHLLDKNGQKMSKSKGNVVDPWEMIGKYGTDAIRWFFYTVNAPGDPKRLDEKDLLLKLRGPLATLWNSFVLFDTYIDKIPNSKIQILNPKDILDQWVIAKLNGLTTAVTERLDAYDIVGAARSLDAFIVDDFSNWYLRRSRRRLQKPETPDEKEAVASVTAHVLVRLIELMAPFTPFLSEIIWQELRSKFEFPEDSVHLRSWPREETRNEKQGTETLEAMDEVRRLATFALAERAKAGIKVRQPLAKLKVKSFKFNDADALLNLLKDEVNIKEVVIDRNIENEVELDTVITSELKEEGFIRELVRNIQEMRRDGGLQPRHTIRIAFVSSPEFQNRIERWKELILREVGATRLGYSVLKDAVVRRDVEIGGQQLTIQIEKISV